MSEPAAETAESPDQFVWRVTKHPGSNEARIEFGSEYADFDGPAFTALLHAVGRGMIQVGTLCLESRASDDDEDWDE